LTARCRADNIVAAVTNDSIHFAVLSTTETILVTLL